MYRGHVSDGASKEDSSWSRILLGSTTSIAIDGLVLKLLTPIHRDDVSFKRPERCLFLEPNS